MHRAYGGLHPLNQNHILSLRNIQHWYARNRSDIGMFDCFGFFAKIWNTASRYPIKFPWKEKTQVLKFATNFPERISTVLPPNLLHQKLCSFSSGGIEGLPMSNKVHSHLCGVGHKHKSANIVPNSHRHEKRFRVLWGMIFFPVWREQKPLTNKPLQGKVICKKTLELDTKKSKNTLAVW